MPYPELTWNSPENNNHIFPAIGLCYVALISLLRDDYPTHSTKTCSDETFGTKKKVDTKSLFSKDFSLLEHKSIFSYH